MVSVVQIRQMQSFDDQNLNHLLARLWPELRPITADKRARIAQIKEAYLDGDYGKPDPSAGRVVWEKSCAKCHTLFGTGGKLDPT